MECDSVIYPIELARPCTVVAVDASNILLACCFGDGNIWTYVASGNGWERMHQLKLLDGFGVQVSLCRAFLSVN
jgi:hypothetical protein